MSAKPPSTFETRLEDLQEKIGKPPTFYRNKARQRSVLLDGTHPGEERPRTKHIKGKSVEELAELEFQALNAREASFVRNMVDGMLPTSAARSAGYANPSQVAAVVLKRPNVQAALLKQRKHTEEVSGMTRKRVMDGFLEAISVGRLQADPLTMIAGWREVAKMCGYYEAVKHKVEVSVNGQVMHSQLQTLSDEELLRLAEGDKVVDGEVIGRQD